MCFIGIVIKSSFISHQNIRNGEKLFECDQCDKTTTFVNYQRIHSEEMPYKCNQCDARFSQRSSLVSHQKHTLVKRHIM